jgi:hypothetical protein
MPLADHVELGKKAQNDNAGNPDKTEDDRDSVEVSLCDAGGTKAGGDSTTKHVANATTTTLVQKNQKSQQETRDGKKHLKDDLQNNHGGPFKERDSN